MIAIETPDIDDDLMEALSKYAPAAYDDLFEEVCRVTAWKSKSLGDWVSAMDADGYRPIALLVADLARIEWRTEIQKMRTFIKDIIELDIQLAPLIEAEGFSQSIPSLTSKLHELRWKRIEKTHVAAEFVKQAITDGQLIVRYGGAPYLPVIDGRDYCFESWLKKFGRADVKTMDRVYPDGRMVVKKTDVANLLIVAGVEVPAVYLTDGVERVLIQKQGKKWDEPISKHRAKQVDDLKKLLTNFGINHMSIPRKMPGQAGHIKAVMRDFSCSASGKEITRLGFTTESFNSTWTEAFGRGLVAYEDEPRRT